MTMLVGCGSDKLGQRSKGHTRMSTGENETTQAPHLVSVCSGHRALDQPNEHCTEVVNMNVTPDISTCLDLNCAFPLKRDTCKLWHLDRTLIPRTATFTIDQRGDHKRRLDTSFILSDVKHEIVDCAISVLADQATKLLFVLQITVLLVASSAESFGFDLILGNNGGPGDLNDMS